MKKAVTVLFLIIMFSLRSFSQLYQSNFTLNSVFVEAGGNAFLYSFNYDRIIVNKRNGKISLRLGIEYIPSGIFQQGKSVFAFPFEINYLNGKDEKFFECGIGVCPGYGIFNYLDDKPWALAFTGRIGYRLQKENGFFFRVGFVPLVYKNLDNGGGSYYLQARYYIYPWAGLSIGKTF